MANAIWGGGKPNRRAKFSRSWSLSSAPFGALVICSGCSRGHEGKIWSCWRQRNFSASWSRMKRRRR